MRQKVSEYCENIGKNPLLVQGPGGNASWKDGDTLWIKASGTWLANAQKEEIFIPVDLSIIRDSVSKNNFNIIPVPANGSYSHKPSIETIFHAVISHPVIIHLHPVCVLKEVVFSDYKSRLMKKLPDNIDWVGVDYYKPGGELARAIYDFVEKDPSMQVFFLQNHGIIVGGSSIDEINNIFTIIFRALSSEPRPLLPVRFDEDDRISINDSYRMVPDEGIQQLALDSVLFDRLASDWALYPDHVVFLGAVPKCIHKSDIDLSSDIEIEQGSELIFIHDIGVFAHSSISSLKLMQLRLYYEILSRLPTYECPNVLNESQIRELLNWDAEKYRINMAK